MSRTAAAPVQTSRYSPARAAYEAGTRVRLLGDEGSLEMALDAAASRSWHAGRAPELAYIGSTEEPSYAPYEQAARFGPLPAFAVRHPAWLLATLVAALTLVAVVSPAFASGKPAGSARRVFLSGYSAAGQPPAPAQGDQAPVIDTTTQPAEAPAQQAATSPADGYLLTGPPSTSVKQIEAVLARYGSPAAGLGQHLYDLGVRYGIDPAYALAFFVHESGCGTKGVARFTHSLGNIRWTDGFDNYEGYRKYASWEGGMEDWYKLITGLYINGWGLRTVDAIIPRYAPSGDNNDPPSYIASVKSLVDTWRGK